ncbi:hypothetical protein [Neoroseomonas terrae]|nr:hypothetical protein [Neoroseomonas terrae]
MAPTLVFTEFKLIGIFPSPKTGYSRRALTVARRGEQKAKARRILEIA